MPTATGATFGSFVGVGVTGNSSGAGRFSFTNQDTGATTGSDAFTGVINTSKYYEVTITPTAGYTLDINSITFTLQRSATGIRQYAVRSSLDYATNLPASISPTNTALSVVATNVFQVTDNNSLQDGSTITLGSGFDALTTATTFRFYGWNAEGTGGTFSIDNVVFNGTASLACSSPSTQATLFTNPITNATSANIGWTRGNGNNVLVVARSGSAVNADPTNGTAYTANAVFGSGTQIGTGNFVVYNGTGSSVIVTGLATGTTYHFAVYEYNTASTCYNATELTGNISTPVVSPIATLANNGTQITIGNVSQNTTDHILHQFRLTITAASTSLTGLACTTSGTYVTTDLINLKVRYSTDNILDLADVTLSTFTTPGVAGTKTFPTFTAQPITVGSVGYIFITADVSATATLGNTIGVNTVTLANVSFTSTPSTNKVGSTTAGGLQTIVVTAPAIPATFTRSCVSNNSLLLNWTAPLSGTYDGYLLVVREAAVPNAVTSIVASSQTFNLDYTLAPTYNATTSRVLYVGNATTATVTGLTQGTSYTFAIYSYKNNGASSIYSVSRTTTQIVNLSNVTGQGATPGNASGTMTWTSPNIACHNEILVVATTTAGITFSPTGNGSLYTPNTVYAGANSVVFNNAGNFVTVTGLTNGVTYYFEIFVRLGTQWSSGVEVSVTPNLATVFKPGELVFVGFDGQYLGSGASDQYMVATMVDILPGTTFAIANTRYEAGAAANVRTEKWGGAGDDPSTTPGVTNFTYNGAGNITAGSVLVFTTNAANLFDYAAVITGTSLVDRTSDFVFSQPFGVGTSPNITTTPGDGEQIYLLQGSFVSDGTIDLNEANYILTGTLLHGFTIKTGWVPFTSACSGVNGGGSDRQSRLPIALNCFNVESSTSTTISGYYENAAQHGSTTLRNIIRAIADVTNNWTLSNTRYTIDATSSASNRAGKTFIISTGEATGQWIGDADTNWFNCSNWGRLTVPDETVDVVIDAVTSVGNAAIDYTAANSDFYLDLAVCNNLTINGRNLIIQGSSNNKIEVYGALTIGSSGMLDMNDSVNATADGQLYLYGNWTNNGTNANFDEGEGTVHFTGGNSQIINNVSPIGTELFYNVILNNDFNTAVSNNLIAQGDLTINAAKIVNISSTGYIFAYKKLNHSGDLTIDNNGQFIQVDESDANTGTYTGTKFQLTRNYTATNVDYVYWGAPTKSFAVSNLPNGFRYEWNPLFANTWNGTQGNWISPSTVDMKSGKGYIARTFNGSATPITLPFTFRGQPNNGTFTTTISRGSYFGDGITTGLPYDAEPSNPNNLNTTRWDDNWNLVSNPYPSAIDALTFLSASNNPNIEGFVYLWTHQQGLVSSVDPYYYDFGLNYSAAANYVLYNALGVSSGPVSFNGKIASGQGFFVLMSDGLTGTNNVTFKNSMRYAATPLATYDNSQFFRTSQSSEATIGEEEKHRIWLDIVSPQGDSNRTLIGYVESATNDKDRLYDAITSLDNSLKIVSYLNFENPQEFIIHGRGLPFNENDTIRLGVVIPSNGTYKIGIGSLDGMFSENQNIFIQDKLLNVIQSIKTQPYSFTATAGKFIDRFVLRYTDTTLGNPDFGTTENSVVIATNQGEMTIKSYVENMQDVTVFDILGRQLFEAKNINNKDFETSTIRANQQALIVKIKLENGTVVTRKIIL